ncbi:PepSY-associated TM helix domain-containing protein [Emcibacter nanhaiensis]|uniref:PepSY domain-containing protein n=1 Tax=Emcibacter nanhaiensis TaxID=1505037 RepID=A0A501PQI3_9PROT|nr:PepSY-associated TM helix domain-containing protein [Emcibacter nanhaiensis]TPD62789.1 PepSY domain-containing protein [Emcibacter nanhaiensis]
MRTDIVKMYKDVHTWTGIISGLFLFIAFYAGAITMFEKQLDQWSSPPVEFSDPPSLEQTQKLVDMTLAARPEARGNYEIHLRPGPQMPARLSWSVPLDGERGRHAKHITYVSSLTEAGELRVSEYQKSGLANFIDILHEQVGLPFDHEIVMPVTGIVALLYAVALISGVIVLVPSLIKDLFALRVGKNMKRMWLDSHNILGLFSLPFHMVMAFTSVIFAFHDEIYDVQDQLLYGGTLENVWRGANVAPLHSPEDTTTLAPSELVKRIREQAPGFEPFHLHYLGAENGRGVVRAEGTDPRNIVPRANGGFAIVDPYSGNLVDTDLLPGHQEGWIVPVTSFFTLHFGSYGGTPVRWGYFILGMAGALLFYTGNLLWIESRRKKERRNSGPVTQCRNTRLMGSLTVGVCLGCVCGISLILAAAKWAPLLMSSPGEWYVWLYYAMFIVAIALSFVLGAAQASIVLLWAAAVLTALVPLSSLTGFLFGATWHYGGNGVVSVDIVACLGAGIFAFMALSVSRRRRTGPRDSIWAKPATSP